MASLYELRRSSGHDIFAVPYKDRRAARAIRLPDGAIVEHPLPAERDEAPRRVADCLEIAQGGVPASIHHINLGLVIDFLPLSGIYLLPDGEVAAVYGAVATQLGRGLVETA